MELFQELTPHMTKHGDRISHAALISLHRLGQRNSGEKIWVEMRECLQLRTISLFTAHARATILHSRFVQTFTVQKTRILLGILHLAFKPLHRLNALRLSPRVCTEVHLMFSSAFSSQEDRP